MGRGGEHRGRLRRHHRQRLRRLHDDALPGHDVVHFDLQPSNLLVDAGRLVGVVDWDGAGRGDRRLDLVTLRFGLHGLHGLPDADGVAQRLDGLLDAMPAAVLEAAWAHMSLRMVDWAIRHFPPRAAEDWSSFAEQRAG